MVQHYALSTLMLIAYGAFGTTVYWLACFVLPVMRATAGPIALISKRRHLMAIMITSAITLGAICGALYY